MRPRRRLKKAEAAKASAQSQFKDLSGDYPIFQEEGLPDDKKLDKEALAQASESAAGGAASGADPAAHEGHRGGEGSDR